MIEEVQVDQVETEVVVKGRRIGGWLIVVLIGLVAGVVLAVKVLYDFLSEFITNYEIISITPLFIVLLLFFITYLGLNLVVLYNFLRKRARTPLLVYISLWFGFLMGIVFSALTDDFVAKDLVKSLITAIIWTLYFYKSVRVKETFIN